MAPERVTALTPARFPQPQPQEPPQQPPPLEGADPVVLPAAATPRSRTVSSCPAGQVAGSLDRTIGRDSVNVAPQARHRNS